MPQLYYHDCSGRIRGHTTKTPPVGFQLETNAFQFYAIANLDRRPYTVVVHSRLCLSVSIFLSLSQVCMCVSLSFSVSYRVGPAYIKRTSRLDPREGPPEGAPSKGLVGIRNARYNFRRATRREFQVVPRRDRMVRIFTKEMAIH